MKRICVLTSLLLPFYLFSSCNKGESNNNPTRIYASSGVAPSSGRVYLWNEGNIPDRTHPTNNGGTRAPFYEQFNINVRCLCEAGITVEVK